MMPVATVVLPMYWYHCIHACSSQLSRVGSTPAYRLATSFCCVDLIKSVTSTVAFVYSCSYTVAIAVTSDHERERARWTRSETWVASFVRSARASNGGVGSTE